MTVGPGATELDPAQRVGFFRDILGPHARGIPLGIWFIRIVDGVDLDHPVEAAEADVSSNSTPLEDDRRRSPGSGFARRATLDLVVNPNRRDRLPRHLREPRGDLPRTQALGPKAGGTSPRPGVVPATPPRRAWHQPAHRPPPTAALAGPSHHLDRLGQVTVPADEPQPIPVGPPVPGRQQRLHPRAPVGLDPDHDLLRLVILLQLLGDQLVQPSDPGDPSPSLALPSRRPASSWTSTSWWSSVQPSRRTALSPPSSTTRSCQQPAENHQRPNGQVLTSARRARPPISGQLPDHRQGHDLSVGLQWRPGSASASAHARLRSGPTSRTRIQALLAGPAPFTVALAGVAAVRYRTIPIGR